MSKWRGGNHTVHNVHCNGTMVNSLAGTKALTTAYVEDGHATAVSERRFVELMLKNTPGDAFVLPISLELADILVLAVAYS